MDPLLRGGHSHHLLCGALRIRPRPRGGRGDEQVGRRKRTVGQEKMDKVGRKMCRVGRRRWRVGQEDVRCQGGQEHV